MYQPGSKYKAKSTIGGEFIFQESNKNYIGDYIELSDGTRLSGIRPGAPNQRLLIPTPNKVKKSYQNVNNEKYALLRPGFEEFYSKDRPVVSTKVLPTEKDYEKFKYTRYFAKKRNSKLGYIGIEKKTYKKLIKKNAEYDHYIWQAGKIEWSLKEGSADVNLFLIKQKEKEFPGLRILYPNLQEFYIPDEFKESKNQTDAIKEDLKPMIPEPSKEQLKNPEVPEVPGLEKVQNKMLDNLRKKIKDRVSKTLKPKRLLKNKKFKPNNIPGLKGGSSGGGGGGY
tara:strand:- start:53 stop:898 length:846 start_codon:yes stop_codon:yes gene_type:complete